MNQVAIVKVNQPGFNASFRRTVGFAFLIFAILGMAGVARAQSEIWLAPRADGAAGSGSPADPYDVSTEQKFDDLLKGYCKTGKAGMTFHLMPGTYHTMGEAAGWACLSNWKLRGAGMDTTIIVLSGYSYQENDAYARNTAFVQQGGFRTGIEITDLTIDCSWLNFGSTLAGSFTVPNPGQTVPVAVVSSTWAKVGKYAYIQRMDNHQPVGIYEVKAVTDGTNVLLRNLQGSDPKAGGNLPPGTRVAGSVYVGPAVNTCGIGIGAKDCVVERIHITDSGTPIYEAPIGIILAHLNGQPTGEPFYLADGNIIRDCIIDNLWGSSGWCIAVISNNPDVGRAGTFISATVENNVIHSNGMHQGLSSWGTANSIWSHNTVTNCAVGWFVDVGYNKDAQIINNTFVNDGTGIQLGGGYVNGWIRFNISGNHILVPQNGNGILLNGQVHQSVLSNNHIFGVDSVKNRAGIAVNPDHTDDNVFSNNIESTGLPNSIPSSVGYGFNNMTVTGSPITVGGASPLVDRAFGADQRQ